MLSQIRWHQVNGGANPFEHFNFVRKTVHWLNGRQMNNYIDNELTKRYNENRADYKGKRTKAIIDLVLQGNIHGRLDRGSRATDADLDSSFRAFAISQIRLFVFAGHDATSSIIYYLLHLLYKNLDRLSQLRREHDQVLGTNLEELPSLLRDQPHIVNDLPYTTAVIKEALRLFPPGGCSCAGQSAVTLFSDSGKECPTENVAAVFTIHAELQRYPTYWNQPDAFLPERWLVKPDHELYPAKGAYRAFEIGPRNCVAQGFVMIELKVILACLVRQFDFSPAFEGYDSLKHPKEAAGVRMYRGERAYKSRKEPLTPQTITHAKSASEPSGRSDVDGLFESKIW